MIVYTRFRGREKRGREALGFPAVWPTDGQSHGPWAGSRLRTMIRGGLCHSAGDAPLPLLTWGLVICVLGFQWCLRKEREEVPPRQGRAHPGVCLQRGIRLLKIDKN